MLGNLIQVSHLVSYHRVCAWQVNTGFVHGNLTQVLCLVSEPGFAFRPAKGKMA